MKECSPKKFQLIHVKKDHIKAVIHKQKALSGLGLPLDDVFSVYFPGTKMPWYWYTGL